MTNVYKMELIIETLHVLGHHSKADNIHQYLVYSQDEIKRLTNIFKKLDEIYKPHNEENPKGLLDSPQSLLEHTQQAIDMALNLMENIS